MSFTVTPPPRCKTPDPEIVEPVAPISITTLVGAAVVPSAYDDKESVAAAFTVNVALTVGIATPKVVVPAEIVKFVKEVKIVAGNVLVASIITVPVPRVQVFPETVLTAKLPVLSVPPAVIVIIPAGGVAPVPPRVTLRASRVDPLVKVIVPVLAVFP
jgi:hypothetical protein